MNKNQLSRTKNFIMKKSQNLLVLSIAVIAFLCVSISDLDAQTYINKDQAITNLINENIALAESLPGLDHNSDLYFKTVEKIRVIKILAGYIKSGKTVAKAVEFTLPGQGRPIQVYIKSFVNQNGKPSNLWAVDEIMPLITQ